MMKKQLYKYVEALDLPELVTFDVSTGEILSSEITREGSYSFTWPNGAPCIPVEMFLLHKASEVSISSTDGGTVKNYATALTHLTRFCYDKKKDFWELFSKDIDEFATLLSSEFDQYAERVRNNTTVIHIISYCVTFLKWLQDNFFPHLKLIGVDKGTKRHQIKLKVGIRRYNKGRKSTYEYFDCQLPRSTPGPKRRISEENIKRLWDALSLVANEAKLSNKFKKKFNAEETEQVLEYMQKRRELQLSLLEATGLRPQELIEIRVKSNRSSLIDFELEIPTKKTRKGKQVYRKIPIDSATAIRIELFIEIYREKHLAILKKHGFIVDKLEADDFLYLNMETGKKVKPDAAYQEFRRLSVKAGIKQKNCQRMFRRRFISNMVKLHLISFLDKNPLKNKYNFADSDYRTILTKVSTFTGHSDPESLRYYIDIAWDELGAHSHAYDVNNLQRKLKNVMYLTSSFKSDLARNKGATKSKIINLVNSCMDEIEQVIDLKNK